MKIRITGTQDECILAQKYYNRFGLSEDISYCSVSNLYPNRNSINQFRVYVDITYNSDYLETCKRLGLNPMIR